MSLCFDKDILALYNQHISKYLLVLDLIRIKEIANHVLCCHLDYYATIVGCSQSIAVVRANHDADLGAQLEQAKQDAANQKKYIIYTVATVACAATLTYIVRNPQVLKGICETFISQLPSAVTEYLGR